MNFSLLDIANFIGGKVIGDKTLFVSNLSPISDIQPDSLVFADGIKNIQLVENSNAAAILVGPDITSEHKTIIQVEHPFKAFIALLEYFHPPKKSTPAIHPTAIIGEDVVIGEHCFIGPFVIIEAGAKLGKRCVLKGHNYIGHDVIIGDHTTLHSHVTVYDNCIIGNHVSIHASTVIGSDGFGYTFMQGEHVKTPHVGYVHIEDNVEIGANAVVDRATLGATIVGKGTKIDNLVQVAHSVKLGKHNILCAFTGIAGSSSTGDHVIFAANVGVSDHVRIDDGVVLGARTGVPPNKHLTSGVYLGSPARPKDKALEIELCLSRVPNMRKQLRALKETIAELSNKIASLEME